MRQRELETVCGLYCGDCPHMALDCRGCESVWGAPSWTKLAGIRICPVFDCCANEKRIEHCGLCDQAPCGKFTEIRAPGVSDEAVQECLKARAAELRRRAGSEK